MIRWAMKEAHRYVQPLQDDAAALTYLPNALSSLRWHGLGGYDQGFYVHKYGGLDKFQDVVLTALT